MCILSVKLLKMYNLNEFEGNFSQRETNIQSIAEFRVRNTTWQFLAGEKWVNLECSLNFSRIPRSIRLVDNGNWKNYLHHNKTSIQLWSDFLVIVQISGVPTSVQEKTRQKSLPRATIQLIWGVGFSICIAGMNEIEI